MAASTSASPGERQASAQRQVRVWSTLSQATNVLTALDPNIDVRVTSQPCFLGREAGAKALASRTLEMSRDCIGCGRALGPSASAERPRETWEDALRTFVPAKMMSIEGPSRETVWSNVQDFLQMRVTARAWNDATKCGPYRELLFMIALQPFLLKR